MDPIPLLAKCAGNWAGTSTLIMFEKDAPDTAPSTATITPVLRGTFVRIAQSWSQGGTPQEGLMLVGFDPGSGIAQISWVDTFHNGRKIMDCTGSAGQDGTIDVRGSYAAPPGPDWGWRIILKPGATDHFEFEMYNVEPGGVEELAVRAVYSRAQ